MKKEMILQKDESFKPKRAQFKAKCRYCKKFGYKKVDCFKYKKQLEKKKDNEKAEKVKQLIIIFRMFICL